MDPPEKQGKGEHLTLQIWDHHRPKKDKIKKKSSRKRGIRGWRTLEKRIVRTWLENKEMMGRVSAWQDKNRARGRDRNAKTEEGGPMSFGLIGGGRDSQEGSRGYSRARGKTRDIADGNSEGGISSLVKEGGKLRDDEKKGKGGFKEDDKKRKRHGRRNRSLGGEGRK